MSESSECGSACSLQSLSQAQQISDENEQLEIKKSLTKVSFNASNEKLKKLSADYNTDTSYILSSHLDYKSGAIYEGKIKDNLKFGQGLFLWPNGDKYMGEFRSNSRHGFGIFKHLYLNLFHTVF